LALRSSVALGSAVQKRNQPKSDPMNSIPEKIVLSSRSSSPCYLLPSRQPGSLPPLPAIGTSQKTLISTKAGRISLATCAGLATIMTLFSSILWISSVLPIWPGCRDTLKSMELLCDWQTPSSTITLALISKATSQTRQAAQSVRDLAMYLQILRGLREKIEEVPGDK
jgi:hypothetical protein